MPSFPLKPQNPVELEIFNIRVAADYGLASFEYGLMVTLEELMEMTGASVFIVALIDYLEDNYHPRLILSLPTTQDVPDA